MPLLKPETGFNSYICIFRYDDYSANSVTDAELKIMEAFRRHGIPITFGVIPFKVTGDPEDPSPRDLLPRSY